MVDGCRKCPEENQPAYAHPMKLSMMLTYSGDPRLAAAEAGERFLLLEDGGALAPLAPWVPSDPHAWSRQHVAHLEATRQRLADGVLLARVLNRTVVLPQFHCYCDKYWGRLAQCTIPHLAHPLASQPLPFVCPVDHVVPVSGWHGNWAARKARGRRCALPGRAGGSIKLTMLRAARVDGPEAGRAWTVRLCFCLTGREIVGDFRRPVTAQTCSATAARRAMHRSCRPALGRAG